MKYLAGIPKLFLVLLLARNFNRCSCSSVIIRGGRPPACPSPKTRDDFRKLFEEVFFSNDNIPALLDYLPSVHPTGTFLQVIESSLRDAIRRCLEI